MARVQPNIIGQITIHTAMKRVIGAWTAIFVAFSLCGLAAAQSQSGSLSDYARDQRKNKPQHETAAPSIYDNDNLPSTETINVVGNSPQTTSGVDVAEKASDVKPRSDQKKKDGGEIETGQSPEERQKAYAEWRKRINKRRDRVDQLARELDSLKQNPPMSVVVLHLWPDDKWYFQLITEKQNALDQATAELSDLQEQARKAGVPSSFTEGESRTGTPQSANERKKAYANAVSLLQTRRAGVPSSPTEIDDDTNDAAENPADSNSPTTAQSQREQKDAGEIKVGQSPEERQKAYAEWKKRLEKRDEKIEQLARELNDLKQNVPTAVILHLWPEDQVYLQIVAEKQKVLDQAKSDRSDLEEHARQAGVPSSFR
jgi:thymidylate synthase